MEIVQIISDTSSANVRRAVAGTRSERMAERGRHTANGPGPGIKPGTIVLKIVGFAFGDPALQQSHMAAPLFQSSLNKPTISQHSSQVYLYSTSLHSFRMLQGIYQCGNCSFYEAHHSTGLMLCIFRSRVLSLCLLCSGHVV